VSNDSKTVNTEDHRALAQMALDELDAPEPNRNPAQLLGGELRWDDRMVQFEAARDPDNAPTLRPHVIAPCQKFSQSHPAIGLRCGCGKGLGFLAIGHFATGVLAITTSHRQAKKYRNGGLSDLALGPNGERFVFIPWYQQQLAAKAQREKEFTTAVSPRETIADLPNVGGVLGDLAHRQERQCPACNTRHLFKNVTLVRLYLKAVAEGRDEIILGQLINRTKMTKSGPTSARKR